MTNLIYIHIGKTLPKCIYDSVYQTLLVSKSTKIYVILDDSLINEFNKIIKSFNINIYTKENFDFELNVQCIPLSILELPIEYKTLMNSQKLNNTMYLFRNSFWIYTIARFFYIYSFMKLFNIQNAFHIENDIMIYENLNIIEHNFLDKNKIYMIKDSPNRVIASLMYLNSDEFSKLLKHILTQLTLNNNLNDMELLGSYTSNNVEYLPFNANHQSTIGNTKSSGLSSSYPYIFDGACIGQYLGGVDPRNISDFDKKSVIEQKMLTLSNPTINFINETCTFKPNTVHFFNKNLCIDSITIPLRFIYTKTENKSEINLKQIVNLHVHSKQLYQFSSVFNIRYDDIITGDRILQLCDFVLSTPGILNYHHNIEYFINIEKVILIKNFENININALNTYLQESNKKVIKLFIYTHILDEFVKYILPYLNPLLEYIIYLHNSDHSLNNNHYSSLNSSEYIKKVYSQNINCEFNSEKFQILPIGLANSMFSHGDTLSLYETIKDTYYLNKNKNLYININPNTFNYRQKVLDEINNEKFNITIQPKPFKDYLLELSQHRFSLCVRGNGLDTHRQWESIYLGVLPVIINNKYTNMDNHVEYMRALGIPFYEIREETLERYSNDFFNETLYKKIIKECGSSLFNLQQLKLSYYN